MDNLFSMHMTEAELRQMTPLAIAHCGDAVFEHLFTDLEHMLSPNTVLINPEKKPAGRKRRDAGRVASRGQTRRRMLR